MSDACTVGRKQDLPPPGGYKPIPYKRVPCKQLFTGFQLLLAYAVVTTGAIFLYQITNKKIKKHQIELRSSKMAIYPMLLAERDREYLKQLHRNRDEEERLMADVEGWEVGTYYGEKIFKLTPDDVLTEPTFQEYYVHSDPREWMKRADIKHWC